MPEPRRPESPDIRLRNLDIRLGRDASLKLDRSLLESAGPFGVDLGPGASVDMNASSMASLTSGAGISGTEGGPVRLHRSSLSGNFGAGISTAGDITLNHSFVSGTARSAGLSSGGTLTLNHSSISGRDSTFLRGVEAVTARNSGLGWAHIDVGPGGVLMLINSSGTIDLPDGPVGIDTAIILGNEFRGFTIQGFEVVPFDWGGVVPDHCVAEHNDPPITCPFGSRS